MSPQILNADNYPTSSTSSASTKRTGAIGKNCFERFRVEVPMALQFMISGGVKGREMKPLPAGYEPTPHDIICGRGRGNYNCQGNLLFRQTVGEFVDQYLVADTKSKKTAVLEKIVAHVKTQNNKCRFIKKQGGAWLELGDILAREKAGHVMREWCTSRADTTNQKQTPKWDDAYAEDGTEDMTSSRSLPLAARDDRSGGFWEDEGAEFFVLPRRTPASAPALHAASFLPAESCEFAAVTKTLLTSRHMSGDSVSRVSLCTTDPAPSSSGHDPAANPDQEDQEEDSLDFFIPPVAPTARSAQHCHRVSLLSNHTDKNHDSILDEMAEMVLGDDSLAQSSTSRDPRGSFTLDNGDLSRSSLHSFAASTLRWSSNSNLTRGSSSSNLMRGSSSSNLMRGSSSSNLMRGSSSSNLMRGSSISNLMRGSSSSNLMVSMRASGASCNSDFSRFSSLSTRGGIPFRDSQQSRTSLRSSADSTRSDRVFGKRVSLVSSSWQQRRISMDDSVLSAMEDIKDDFEESHGTSELDMNDPIAPSSSIAVRLPPVCLHT